MVLAGGCASAPPAPPSGAVDLNGQPGQGETTVVVDNQNLNEMTIYAYQGTQRMRLGRARGTSPSSLGAEAGGVVGVVAEHGGGSGVAFAWEMQLLSGRVGADV